MAVMRAIRMVVRGRLRPVPRRLLIRHPRRAVVHLVLAIVRHYSNDGGKRGGTRKFSELERTKKKKSVVWGVVDVFKHGGK